MNRRFLYIFLLPLICTGCSNSFFASSVGVIEEKCDGDWRDDSLCNGKLVEGSRLDFHINPVSKSVIFTVDKNSGDWFVTSVSYKDCAIVDSDNWECESGYEKIGMHKGIYKRYSLSPYTYQIGGLTGWRYWLHRLSLKEAALIGMQK